MKKIRLLSVIIPASNEERRIKKTLISISKYLRKKKINHEIIVVDDGSSDKTAGVVKNMNIRILKNNKNMGKGFSVRRGMLECRGDYALFSDADLSTPIEQLDNFLKYVPRYDIIIASRKKKGSIVVEKQPFYRVFAGKIFPFISRFATGIDINDTQCGFKLFNMKKCRFVFKKQQLSGFSFDVEILYIALKHNLLIKELGVRWYNDTETKLHILRDPFLMFLDLIRIRINDAKGLYS
jgi:dolichyl-phosphate beta-glucosyltransferase